MNQGWICPVCRRGARPDMQTCDHGNALATIAPQAVPAWQPLYETGNDPRIVTGGGCIFVGGNGTAYGTAGLEIN